MIARYGHRWTSQFGEAPSGAAVAEWADTLGDTRNAVLTEAFALDADRGDGFPPSSAQFLALCMRARAANAPSAPAHHCRPVRSPRQATRDRMAQYVCMTHLHELGMAKKPKAPDCVLAEPELFEDVVRVFWERVSAPKP